MRNYSIKLDEHNCLTFESDIGQIHLFLTSDDINRLRYELENVD